MALNAQGSSISGSVLGGVGGLLAYALTEGGEDEYRAAVQTIREVQDPNFDFSKVTPAQLLLVAKYAPEVYEAVVPAEVKLAKDSPELRTAQAQGLQHWQAISREGLSESERLGAIEAQGRVRQGYRQAMEGSLRNLQERGQAGGGAELALRASAGQTSADLARAGGADLAQLATQNRLTGLEQGTELSGQMRWQDIALSRAQAEDYNRFQEFVSQLKTQAAANASASRQQTSNLNVQQGQRIADLNATNRQQTQESNLQRLNQLRDQLARFRLQRASGVSQGLGNLGYYKEAQRAGLVNLGAGVGGGLGSLVGGLY